MAPSMTEDGLSGRIIRFWHRSYAGEYIGIITILIVYILIQLFVEPFHRMFSLDDRSKSYPHAIVERVSAIENIVYAGVLPLIVLVLWAILTRPEFHKAHVTILGLLESLLLTSLITDVVKNTVGRPRPDLIDRCQPRPGTPAHELVTVEVCTQLDHHTLHDGWRSFPSGHSSFAFAGLGYLCLVIGGQLHVLRPQTDLARFLLFVFPLVCAALIAISRVEDYRHDVYDVTVGSLLGMLVAHALYRRNYRGLRHSKCHTPYANKAQWTARSKGNARDEEQRIQDTAEFELEDTDDDHSEMLPLRNVDSGERIRSR